MSLINWILFGIILTTLITVGIWHARRVKTESTYLLAGRATGLFALIATLVMTEFNTATLLAFSALGYSAGWPALSLAAIFLIGLLFYAAVAARKWKHFNGVSVAHYFAARYGKVTGHLVAIVLFCAMVGFSAVYLKSLTLLFMPVLPSWSPWLISTVITLLVIAMSLRGGLVSIINTDVISFIFVLILFPLLLYFASTSPHMAQSSLIKPAAHLSPKFVASLIFLTMFSYILAPWYGQKVISARNSKTAILAVTISAFAVAILYGIGIAATAILRHKGVVLGDADLAIPYIIRNATPGIVQSFAYAILFTIGATTLSGIWNAMTTLIVGELKANENVMRSYWITLVCIILAWVFSNVITNSILDEMILANIPIVALSFALLAGFYWQRTTRLAAYFSILIGIVWGIGCYWYLGNQGLYTWYWSVYGIPLIFITGIIVSLADRQWQLSKKMLHRIRVLG